MTTGDAKRLVARLQWLKKFTSPTTAPPPGQAVAARMPSIQPDSNITVTLRTTTDDGAPREMKEDPHDIAEADDLDGKSLDEDLDGDPIDGEAIEKATDEDDDGVLNGEALHVDGGTVEDELDGEPLGSGWCPNG
ncbi:hypothetical protein V7S43_004395 [Phytophthora oleae]|uniref:Uncharacterized protein n=1 Tax=Phytophthora oleae TaxID=2107226 RepID=A0ABD3FV16_9STRA